MEPVEQHVRETGGALLLVGVPKGTTVGIDFMSWTIGPNFMGFQLVPAGPHFVFTE